MQPTYTPRYLEFRILPDARWKLTLVRSEFEFTKQKGNGIVMKRRIVSICLILAMLLSFAVIPAFAEEVTIPNLPADRLVARAGAVEVDGVPEKNLVMNYSLASDRSGWVTLGAAWNAQSKMLYIGVLAEHAEYYAEGEIGWGKQKSRENAKIDDVTVTVGETVYRFTEGALVNPENEALAGSVAAGRIGEVDGAYLEFAIPLAALSVWKNDDGVVFTDLSVRVDIAENTETFEGAVLFTSQSVTWESTVAGEYGVSTEKHFSQKAIGAALVKDYENGMLVEDISLAVIENGVNQFHHIGSGDLFPKDGTTTVEMDFLMPANVPVSAPKTTEASSNGWGNQFLATSGNGMRALIYLGAGGQVIVDGWRASAAFPIVLGIYNTADGLTVYLDNGQSPYGGEGVKLGKQAGEYVRLGFETTPVEGGYRVTVLVDGIAVGNMTATAAHATMPLNRGNVLGLGCASDILENPVEKAGAHIIYSNLSVSQNTDADPAEKLSKVAGSFNGVPNSGDQSTSEQRTGTMVVTHGKITVDGEMGKYTPYPSGDTGEDIEARDAAKIYLYEDACLVPDTLVGGDVYAGAVWSKNTGKLYLGMLACDTQLVTVTASLGGAEVTLTPATEAADTLPEFAFGHENKVLELAIPMTDMTFAELGDSIYAPMTLHVTTTEGDYELTGTLRFSADEMFASHTSSYAGYNGYVRSEYGNLFWHTTTASSGASKTDIRGGRTFRIVSSNANDVATYSILALNNVDPWIKRICTYAEADILVDSLPIGEPQTNEKSGYSALNPARIQIMIGRGFSGGNMEETLLMCIYNTANGLMLVRDNNKPDEVPDEANRAMLNKNVGEAFTLGIRWHLDGSVDLVVDGETVANLGAVEKVTNRAWSSSGFGFYIGVIGGTNMRTDDNTETVDVTVTNVSLGRGYEWDAAFFSEIAEGNVLPDDTTHGGVKGEVTPPTPPTPTPGGEDTGSDTKPGDDKPTPTPSGSGDEDTSGDGNATDAPAEEKKGCKSAILSGSWIVLLAMIPAAFVGVTRKRKD